MTAQAQKEVQDHAHVAVLDHRVTQLEKVIESIDNSLKTLVSLEVKHTQTAASLERAFGVIEHQGTRIAVIEGEMPTLKLVRGWVIAGVLGIMGLFGVALAHLAMAPAEAKQEIKRGSGQ